MKKSVGWLAGTCFLFGCSLAVQAQQDGGVYTSPGHPLVVGRHTKTPYSPLKQLPPIARFWHTTDPATRALQAHDFATLLAGRTRLPTAFLRHKAYTLAAPTVLRLQFRVVIKPEGQVASSTALKPTDNKTLAYSPELLGILEQEALRAIGSLQFLPTATSDTVTIPLNYYVE